MSRKSAQHSVLCFDRTPLFIGVMILPLAASCAFINGGLLQRMLPMRSAAEQVEVRAIVADRDRRQQSADFSQAEHDEEPAGHKTASPPAYAANSGYSRIPSSIIFRAARVETCVDAPFESFSSSITSRGPPRAV